METGERLSAYLAGELDPDETAALEAELAGDSALRAQLDRIRRSNQALAALPDVHVPAAFSSRLRDVLRDEIDGRAASPEVDELAARRLQRRAGMSRFVGVGVAAAAVAVVGGIGLSQLLGGGDDADGGGVAAISSAPNDEAAMDPLAAYVQVTDTDYDPESVQALAEREAVLDLPSEVGESEARDLEASRYDAFGLGPGGDAMLQAPAAGEAAGTSAGSDTAGGDTGGGADGMGTGPEDDAAIDAQQEQRTGATDPLADVRRCLPEIVSTASEPVIPLYAEVAAFEGEPAIIYLVLTREPGDRLFTRIEAWVVGRSDCFPLLFQQVQRSR